MSAPSLPTGSQVDHALLAGLVELVERAGKAILEVYSGDFAVESKSDGSPLTLADRRSHDILVSGLRRLAPAVPVLSEESSDEHPAEVRETWRRFWLVDPLDGTKEFVKRNGEFTVNVALVDDAAPVLGIVHAPVPGTSYLGDVMAGEAWRLGPAGERTPVKVAPPVAGVTVAVSRSHAGAETERYVAALERRFGSAERMTRGSALKACLVAEGTAHYYPRLGPTMAWDTAAAQAVLEAAGGAMLGLADGEPLRYPLRSLVNPSFVAVYAAEAFLPEVN